MAELVPASAIVLAGGRSRRFGAQKLSVEIEGEPIIHRAVRAASIVCAEVIVVGPSTGLPIELPMRRPSRPRLVLDDVAHPGPLVALVHAAEATAHDRLLLVAGDMPDLQSAVLRRLLAWPEGREGACLVDGGVEQPFPMGLARASTLGRGRRLVEAGARSLRALIDALHIERVPEPEWRELDPEARSLRDIDRPSDL